MAENVNALRTARRASRREARKRRYVGSLAGYEHGPDATLRATATALARADGAASIVLVEGISDQIAVETLAERLGRRLVDERIVVLPIGGAHAIDRFVPRFTDRPAVRLSGLCDRAELGFFAGALGRDDIGPSSDIRSLESQGFHVCDADLEDELIRALDLEAIEGVLAEEGDLAAFRTLQRQPEWRNRSFEAQMHRWLRSHARRTSRYARLLTLAAERDRLPRPLQGVVLHM